MKIFKEKEVSYIKKELVKTVCDICGLKAKSGNWETSTYEVNEVEVKVEVRQKEGSNYPDGGWGTQYQADICPGCFKNKLIPFLRLLGCNAQEEEWNW